MINKIKIINCTPHQVNTPYGDYEPSGIIPKIEMEKTKIKVINNMPVNNSKPVKIVDLPQEKPNTIYIVSRMVAEAVPNRDDLIFPDELIRNEKGQIIGCSEWGMI